jgi:hypothetical protein
MINNLYFALSIGWLVLGFLFVLDVIEPDLRTTAIVLCLGMAQVTELLGDRNRNKEKS